MSGSIADLLARPVGIDVLTPLKKAQELALGQEQTQAAQIANERARLMLGIREQGAAGFLGRQGSGFLPPVDGAPNDGGAPAGNGYLPGARGAPQGQQGQRANGVPYGGVWFPPDVTSSIWESENRADAFSKAIEQRRVRTMQALTQPDWGRGVAQLAQEGWLSPDDARVLAANPAARDRIIQGLQGADAYASNLATYFGHGVTFDANGKPVISPVAVAATGVKAEAQAGGTSRGELPLAGPLAGARAGATVAATSPYETVPVMTPVPGKPGEFINNTVQRSQLPAFMKENAGAREPTAADHANPAVSLSPSSYAGRVQGAENTSGNPGERNPRSTAMGDHQFLEQRWLDTVAAAKPAWAQGMSQTQLLAARADSGKSAQMAYALAQENGPKLAAAGQPVNSLTLGLAHQFGADGADRLLKAPPGAAVASLVDPLVIAANPGLRNATVAQVLGEKFQKYGVNQVDLSAPWSSGPPGAIAGPTTLGPVQAAGLKVAEQQIEADRPLVAQSMQAGRAAQLQIQNIDTMNELGAHLDRFTGSGAETRAEISKWIATYAPAMGPFFDKATTGLIDPTKAHIMDAFAKAALTASGTASKAVADQGGIGMSELYLRTYPSVRTQPMAIPEVNNVLRAAHQQTIDWADNQQRHYEAQQAQLGTTGKYQTVAAADAQFLKTNGPRVYVAGAALLNGKPTDKALSGLTMAQKKEAYRVAWRINPAARLTLPDGTPNAGNPELGNGG